MYNLYNRYNTGNNLNTGNTGNIVIVLFADGYLIDRRFQI